jgi:hypothetical protein
MRRKITTAALIALAICGVLLASVLLVPRSVLDHVLRDPTDDTFALRSRAADLATSLRAGDVARIYRLFNSSFQDEIRLRQLDSAIRAWTRDRPIDGVATTYVKIQGIAGLVSSHIFFREPSRDTGNAPRTVPARPRDYDFLFQYWLRSPEGWELMWLTKILDPISMDYGRQDTAAIEEIVQLALDEIVTRRGIQEIFGIRSLSDRVVLVSAKPPDIHLSLPGKRVIWIAKDSLDAYRATFKPDFYVEVQPLRILKSIAVGTFDVVPLTGKSGAATNRPRSIKLFFTKVEGKWTFANYGGKW